jgi:dTMP kinase
MREVSFYGPGIPYTPITSLPGYLVVIEGTDSVGRSTQTELLKGWLEEEGYGVLDTGLARSSLTQPGLNLAKVGHSMDRWTMGLFYATDFADRLENRIIPALRSGFNVLSDRYFYSIIARAVVRGVDPKWAREVYGFALKPDIIFYLKTDVPTLVSRVVHGRGFDYWESGMDMGFADNLYDSFCRYQSQLVSQFDLMADEFGFVTVDATRSVKEIFSDLKTHIEGLMSEEQ